MPVKKPIINKKKEVKHGVKIRILWEDGCWKMEVFNSMSEHMNENKKLPSPANY